MNMTKKLKETNNKLLGKRMGISPFFSTISEESCKNATPFLYKNDDYHSTVNKKKT